MTQQPRQTDTPPSAPAPVPAVTDKPAPPPRPTAARKMQVEIGGPAGPEPTRYGDWEQKGRCTDF